MLFIFLCLSYWVDREVGMKKMEKISYYLKKYSLMRQRIIMMRNRLAWDKSEKRVDNFIGACILIRHIVRSSLPITLGKKKKTPITTSAFYY